METKEKELWSRVVSERYSSDALAYRDLWAPLLLPHGRRLLEALPLSSAARILDIGSGCGALLPAIRERAPAALVIAVDSAPGMLAVAPPGTPRARMDAGLLALAPATIDAAILAFVLFHTADPGGVLKETRRVLRPGGAIGTTTWVGDPDFPAQRVWIEALDSHGAGQPASQMMSSHEPVGTPERMRALLQQAGFGSIRTWTGSFAHRYTLEEFIAARTQLGWSKRRVDSLASPARASFLRDARSHLEKLDPGGFLDDTGIIFTTAIAD